MNYCSIQDAWGKPNTISNQLKEYNNTKNKDDEGNKKYYKYNNEDDKEHFADVRSENVPSYYTRSESRKNSNYTCAEIMNHLKNCRVCSNNIRKQYRSPLLDNINNMIDDNRETLVLVLMGISILLFINLINNLTSK